MNLKNLRLEMGKTQLQVAHDLDMQRTRYARIEAGESNPDSKTLIELADYFKTTTDNILGHKVPYLLDKSTLTEEQKEVIDIVTQMNYEECKIMLAYAQGVKKGIEERNAKFYKREEI